MIPDERTPDLEELLRSLRPRIRMLFTRHRISPEEAESMLTGALFALVWHGRAVEDPGTWLMVTLRNRCSTYWRRRPGRERGRTEVEAREDRTARTDHPQPAAGPSTQSAPAARAPRQRELVLGRVGLALSPGAPPARRDGASPGARTLTRRTLRARGQDLDRLGEPTRRARRRQ